MKTDHIRRELEIKNTHSGQSVLAILIHAVPQLGRFNRRERRSIPIHTNSISFVLGRRCQSKATEAICGKKSNAQTRINADSEQWMRLCNKLLSVWLYDLRYLLNLNKNKTNSVDVFSPFSKPFTYFDISIVAQSFHVFDFMIVNICCIYPTPTHTHIYFPTHFHDSLLSPSIPHLCSAILVCKPFSLIHAHHMTSFISSFLLTLFR